MRRDMDLIRQIMLKLEALPSDGVSYFSVDQEKMTVDGFTPDEVNAHLAMIYDADLVIRDDDGQDQMLDGRTWVFRRLSPRGHDFIDTVRSPEAWRTTKDVGRKAGGWSLGLMMEVSKAVIKEELKVQLAKIGIPLA